MSDDYNIKYYMRSTNSLAEASGSGLITIAMTDKAFYYLKVKDVDMDNVRKKVAVESLKHTGNKVKLQVKIR